LPPKYRFTIYMCKGTREEGICRPINETKNMIEALIEALAALKSADLVSMDIEKVEEGEDNEGAA